MMPCRAITVVRRVFFLIWAASIAVGCGGGGGGDGDESVDAYFRNLPAWDEFSPQLDYFDGETGDTSADVQWVDDTLYVCQMTPCSIKQARPSGTSS